MSCPAFTGTGTLLREGECVWGRITSAHTTQSATADDVGYRQTALSYQSGLQTEFAPDWFFGLTGAYTRAIQSDPDRITGTTSDAADVSAALKHQIGPWLLAASANLGYSWADNKRLIDFGGATATARSKSGISHRGRSAAGELPSLVRRLVSQALRGSGPALQLQPCLFRDRGAGLQPRYAAGGQDAGGIQPDDGDRRPDRPRRGALGPPLRHPWRDTPVGRPFHRQGEL